MLKNSMGWNETQPPCLFEPCVENSMGLQGRVLTSGGTKKKKSRGLQCFPLLSAKWLVTRNIFSYQQRMLCFLLFFIFTKTESHMWGEVAGTAGNQWKQKLHFLLAHVENSPTNQRRRNKTKHMECFSTTTKHFIFSCKSMHVLTTVTLFHKKVLLLFCSLLVYIWWRKMFKIKPKLLFYFVLT